MNRLVTIVIPARNEAAAIGRTLRTLPIETLRAEGYDVETIVLDGRSNDATATIARRHGAMVLPDRGRGKGRALRDARRHFRGEYVVMIDADGSYATDAIPRLLDQLVKGEADIVMGRRVPRPGSMSGLHRVGNAVLSLQASLLYGRACLDVCTGLWGFRAGALRLMPLRAQGFELEAELFSLAARLGLKTVTVPVDYMPRDGDTKLSTSRDGIRIGWCLLSTRFRTLPVDGSPEALGTALPPSDGFDAGVDDLEDVVPLRPTGSTWHEAPRRVEPAPEPTLAEQEAEDAKARAAEVPQHAKIPPAKPRKDGKSGSGAKRRDAKAGREVKA